MRGQVAASDHSGEYSCMTKLWRSAMDEVILYRHLREVFARRPAAGGAGRSFAWTHLVLLVVLQMLWVEHAAGHGGVVYEDDQCVLKVGFLMAHFTGFQPETRGSEEFCEDIPDPGESVFVIEYLHDFMREMPVDFRVIRDVRDFGVYASWEDVQSLDDLTANTVLYLPPARYRDGVVTARHNFVDTGGYIGVVTANNREKNKMYNAVFFFRVGGRNYGSLVLFGLLALLVQLGYLASTGSLQRFVRVRFPRRK